MTKLRVGVLASGRGSNFQSIINAIESGYINAEICILITDNPTAMAIERAERHGITQVVVETKSMASNEEYYKILARILTEHKVGLIVLAGFMRIIGKPLIDAFPNRIMNIHPALLPAFPGLHGQAQAIHYGVKLSGCTVHFVDEGMDTGPIIIQAAVPVSNDDTEETLSERILVYEHKIYPEAVRLFSEGRLEVVGKKVMVQGMTPDGGISNPQIA